MLAFLRIQARADAEIIRLLRQFAREAVAEIRRLTGTSSSPAVQVSAAQARAVRAAIFKRQTSIFRSLRELIDRYRREAVEEAVRANAEFDKALEPYGLTPDKRDELRRGELARAERNIELLVRRVTNGTAQRTLSLRVYRTEALSKGWVENAIRRGIATGLSPAELARTVRGFIDPATPGGVAYAAMRLARTELNNAFHAAAQADMQDKPWVNGVRWRLSGSHPPNQKLDYCDSYAAIEYFPVDKVPDKPHPNCLCSIVPVLDEPDEFRRKLKAGLYDN